MSKDWVKDIFKMHKKYGAHKAMNSMNAEKLEAFYKFRAKFLQEELDEFNTAKNADDAVDALIDLCVVAIGTLDAFGVDSHKAWDAVLEANMNKEVGIKASRPNPLGLPDLIKPEGWVAPSHLDNIGRFEEIF
jgi:predicted HAD superfamily Cof-like phosphohydrolase